ncbi:MAG: YncE family protein, partial [Phycisphaerae bacterium]
MTPLTGGAVDIVLDAGRQRLYLVGVPNKVEVYSIPQRRFLTSITTDSLPLAAAISRDGRSLYVACHNAATVNVIDLETLGVVNRISLPSRPEGIAVGGDNRVLITTIGTGVNNAQNTLLLYDPALTDSRNLTSLTLTPPTPASPGTSPTGQLIQTNRSFLATSNDGRYIIGVNIPNTTTRAVFVYEVGSATMLRSRTVNNISSVLSVSPDGGK